MHIRRLLDTGNVPIYGQESWGVLLILRGLPGERARRLSVRLSSDMPHITIPCQETLKVRRWAIHRNSTVGVTGMKSQQQPSQYGNAETLPDEDDIGPSRRAVTMLAGDVLVNNTDFELFLFGRRGEQVACLGAGEAFEAPQRLTVSFDANVQYSFRAYVNAGYRRN
jgi:hypothetical protein